MKCITIRNPWADLICQGIKNVENRSWKTNFRGRILVHSAKKIDNYDYNFNSPCSAIIGSVEIIDCIQDSNLEWAIPGQWHWILKNPELFKYPITNIKGALSFWDVPEGICIPI